MEYVLGFQGRLYVSAGDEVCVPAPPLPEGQIEERYPVTPDLELIVASTPPEGFERLDLRAELSLAAEEHFSRLSRATQIAVWHDQHRFCGRCGTQSKPNSLCL